MSGGRELGGVGGGAMRSVLGIDAAWTIKNPSGVALVAEIDQEWKLIRAAGSYSEFIDPGSPRANKCHKDHFMQRKQFA